MRESLFFFHAFVSVRQKFIPRPPVIKIQRNSVLMRIFLFFLQAQKRSKRREKDTNARSHSHHHHSSSHFFISSRVVTPPTPTKTHRTTITLPLLLRDFLRFHTGRERESVCVFYCGILSLSVSLSLTRTHAHTHTRTHARTHTHTHTHIHKRF